MKKTLLNWFHTVMNMKPMKPTPLSYDQVATKMVLTIGPDNELYLEQALKGHETCWVWGLTVKPDGMIWIMDADMTWGELNPKEVGTPRILDQIAAVILSMRLNNNIKIA